MSNSLSPDPSALRALVEQGAAQLTQAKVSFGHGTTCAFDESAWLVLHALGLPLDQDLDQPVAAVTDESWQRVAPLFEQRIATRKPAAYITGEAWLQGVAFCVDERVIVPRSFIAELIADGGFDAWLSDDTTEVLDLCTGNGSLAVLAAMAYPEVNIDACDLSLDALAVAKINVDRHNMGDRIRLFQSDGLSACTDLADLASPKKVYDLILCNPPYVNATSMAALPPEYQAEPAMALASGADGMDFIRTLLSHVWQHLSSDGVLVLEIGNERANFERAFPGLDPAWLATSAGADQVLLIQRDMLLLQPT